MENRQDSQKMNKRMLCTVSSNGMMIQEFKPPGILVDPLIVCLRSRL